MKDEGVQVYLRWDTVNKANFKKINQDLKNVNIQLL